MLSHDLARALLAHRNNDIRVEVLVDDDPSGVRDIWAKRIELRDGGAMRGSEYHMPGSELVAYDGEDDVVVIRAGFVVLGGAAT